MILKLSLTVLLLYYLAVLWKYYRQDIAGMFGTAETDEGTDEPDQEPGNRASRTRSWEKAPTCPSERRTGRKRQPEPWTNPPRRTTGGLLRHRAGGGRGGDGL